MKLNPTKCVFAVASRKFLGFMVSQRGIEENLDKVKAIIEVKSPKTMKEVQSLTWKVVALNKFVSRATDKCMPFFKVLKQAFQWIDECEEAFAMLKEYLTKSPLLSPLMIGEKLYLYLVVSNTCSKFGTNQRRKKRTEARLLHQPSISRCRGKLPKDGKDSFHIIGYL